MDINQNEKTYDLTKKVSDLDYADTLGKIKKYLDDLYGPTQAKATSHEFVKLFRCTPVRFELRRIDSDLDEELVNRIAQDDNSKWSSLQFRLILGKRHYDWSSEGLKIGVMRDKVVASSFTCTFVRSFVLSGRDVNERVQLTDKQLSNVRSIKFHLIILVCTSFNGLQFRADMVITDCDSLHFVSDAALSLGV